MIVDSSALIAVLRDEPEREEFSRLLASSSPRMSVANWLEAAMVADGSGDDGAGQRLDALIDVFEIALVDVTAEHARRARLAFRRFGRGSGSAARLNYGDCVAYALATADQEPLLFKGEDFTHTDVPTL